MKRWISVYLIVLIIYLISNTQAAVTREQMEKMANGFRNTCISKTGADRTLVEGIRDGNFVEDPLSKCYTKCIMSLMKTFTKQGTIDLDLLLKQINIMATSDMADLMAAAAKKCYEETTADDPCELAWSFTKCVYAAEPSVYFFP